VRCSVLQRFVLCCSGRGKCIHQYTKTDLHICRKNDLYTATHHTAPNETAIHCNTLQHTTAHCSTLQHIAAHCSTLQHIAAHCNTQQRTTAHCSTLQHIAAHCSTLQHIAAHCNTQQRTTAHCNTTLHLHLRRHQLQRPIGSTLQHTTPQHNTTQHDTLQHTATHCNNTATQTCIYTPATTNSNASSAAQCHAIHLNTTRCNSTATALQQHCNSTATALQHKPASYASATTNSKASSERVSSISLSRFNGSARNPVCCSFVAVLLQCCCSVLQSEFNIIVAFQRRCKKSRVLQFCCSVVAVLLQCVAE